MKGIDYSPSVWRNHKGQRGRHSGGPPRRSASGVANMIFADDWFDAVTAFETVYFWPDLPRCSGGLPGAEARRDITHLQQSNGDTDKGQKGGRSSGGVTPSTATPI